MANQVSIISVQFYLRAVIHTFLRTADNVENVIVNASRQLSQAAVPEGMLGIQFVQIGNDSDATKFLQHLDSQLKKEHQITVGEFATSCLEMLTADCFTLNQDMVGM